MWLHIGNFSENWSWIYLPDPRRLKTSNQYVPKEEWILKFFSYSLTTVNHPPWMSMPDPPLHIMEKVKWHSGKAGKFRLDVHFWTHMDLMILRVFFNLGDSIILWLCSKGFPQVLDCFVKASIKPPSAWNLWGFISDVPMEASTKSLSCEKIPVWFRDFEYTDTQTATCHFSIYKLFLQSWKIWCLKYFLDKECGGGIIISIWWWVISSPHRNW